MNLDNWLKESFAETVAREEKEKKISALQKKLARIEKELDTCRTSTIQDGWQTSKYAKKARKWDVLAQEKHLIRRQLEELLEDN